MSVYINGDISLRPGDYICKDQDDFDAIQSGGIGRAGSCALVVPTGIVYIKCDDGSWKELGGTT